MPHGSMRSPAPSGPCPRVTCWYWVMKNTAPVIDPLSYLLDPRTPIAHAHGLLVLTLSGDRISALTRFLDNSLLPYFGLPRTLRDPWI
jgi:hypothetical protein